VGLVRDYVVEHVAVRAADAAVAVVAAAVALLDAPARVARGAARIVPGAEVDVLDAEAVPQVVNPTVMAALEHVIKVVMA